MKKRQQKIQITLILIGLILIVATYFYYPSLDKNFVSKNQTIKKNLKGDLEDTENTTFENIIWCSLTLINIQSKVKISLCSYEIYHSSSKYYFYFIIFYFIYIQMVLILEYLH